MTGEICAGAALAAGGYWLFNKIRGWSRRRAASERTQGFDRQIAERMRQHERQRLQQARQRQQAAVRMNSAARLMQVALLQLRQAPDFRRAAGFAQLAHYVPASFRLRQFQRFRPQIAACLSQRLQSGMPLDQASAGLVELVTGLGAAPYEAEYLVSEVQGTTGRAPVPPRSFADQIRQSQAEHTQRVETIQGVEGLEPELREQLLELEQQRLRDQLLGNGDDTQRPGI